MFTVCSYGNVAIWISIELQRQLTTCICDGLRLQAYSPPCTPDTSITDGFYSEAARALLARVKADGWVIQPPRTEGADPLLATRPSDITTDADEDLRFCMRVALSRYPLKPPRSRHAVDWERYYGSVAEAVMKGVLRSHWQLVRAIQKQPPRPLHATPPYRG